MNGNQDQWILKLNNKIEMLEEDIVYLNSKISDANQRINNLEVKLDNLRVEYDNHQFHSPKTTTTRSIECENCGWFNDIS